jgi:hypothetical protein
MRAIAKTRNVRDGTELAAAMRPSKTRRYEATLQVLGRAILAGLASTAGNRLAAMRTSTSPLTPAKRAF